jgi:hypothetical protein
MIQHVSSDCKKAGQISKIISPVFNAGKGVVMAMRKDQEFHDKVCEEVARLRFSFAKPGWKTFVNHPEKQIGFNNYSLFPDVVAVDSNKTAQALGEVETDDTVNDESAKQWAEYGRIAKLYVYVPAGYGSNAARLAGNTVAGIREYSAGNGQLKITNYGG